MIFVYLDKPSFDELDKYKNSTDTYIINNISDKFIFKNKFISVSYKKACKNLTLVPYKEKYKDFKSNTLESALEYLGDSDDSVEIEFNFICNDKQDPLICIDSLLKRRNINNFIFEFKQTNNFTLSKIQIIQILQLTKFLFKTKVITKNNNFFDFVYNYYFCLNKN